ncbi:MAG: fibronectin type III domain-containing protein [Flavobacteriales bacterium]
MSNIRSGLSGYANSGLLALLNNVTDKVTVNAALFPDLPIPVATLTALATAFTNSINKATKGSQAARMARDNKAAQVRTALTSTANYIRMVANGDGEILANSGFPLVKQREPAGRVEAPLLKAARMTGVVGEAELIWTKVPGAYSYQVFRTETDPAEVGAVWLPVQATTKSRCYVNGLMPYKAYWFAVQALGSEGASALSDPAIGRAA